MRALRNDYEARTALGAILRGDRRKSGLRQTEVAEALGRTQSFVSKYERGEIALSVNQVMHICDVISSSLETVMRRMEEELRTRRKPT